MLLTLALLANPAFADAATCALIPSTSSGQHPAARIVSTGADSSITSTFCDGTAGYTSDVYLVDPTYQYIATGHVTPVGNVVDLGVFMAGDELIFSIYVRNTRMTYYSGPGERNPDGEVHAAVTDVGDGMYVIGFEDLYGGGDRDYDDINLVIHADVVILDPCADSGGDTDDDGICDDADNCVDDANTLQQDADGDYVGDVCDACPYDADNDADEDGWCGDVDNCPSDANVDQANADMDLYGDVCDDCPLDPDNDVDGDGWCAEVDNCPADANADQANADMDLTGDVCDDCPLDPLDDADGDGYCADVDTCPDEANGDQADADGDGLGDTCDDCPYDPGNDADEDGVCGDLDLCADTWLPDGVPTVSLGVNRFADIDGDGVFDTTSPRGRGPMRSYTIEQTGGCTCEQIVDALGLGEGHVKFGCSISAMDEWTAVVAGY